MPVCEICQVRAGHLHNVTGIAPFLDRACDQCVNAPFIDDDWQIQLVRRNEHAKYPTVRVDVQHKAFGNAGYVYFEPGGDVTTIGLSGPRVGIGFDGRFRRWAESSEMLKLACAYDVAVIDSEAAED